MASEKQVAKWQKEALKINDNPKYVSAYVEYKQLAKKVDQKLVRLEALSHEKHFEGVLEFAYKTAMHDIKSWGGDRRFNTAPPSKLTELEAKIADMKKFDKKPTSGKREILKFYNKRTGTFNARYGKDFDVHLTWQDLANYYENEEARRNDVKLASKSEAIAIAAIKKLDVQENRRKKGERTIGEYYDNLNELEELSHKDTLTESEEKRVKKLIEDIDDAKKKIKRISGNDKILENNLERLLSQGLNYDTLMGGN